MLSPIRRFTRPLNNSLTPFTSPEKLLDTLKMDELTLDARQRMRGATVPSDDAWDHYFHQEIKERHQVSYLVGIHESSCDGQRSKRNTA